MPLHSLSTSFSVRFFHFIFNRLALQLFLEYSTSQTVKLKMFGFDKLHDVSSKHKFGGLFFWV